MIRVASIVLALAWSAAGQATAGFTKEELQIAEQFDAELASARQTLQSDAKSAIEPLQALLAKAEQHAFLQHQRPGLLAALGHAYLSSGSAMKAVEVYTKRLALAQDDCAPASTNPVGCGRARLDLAVAKIVAGQPDGLGLLEQAVEDHRKQVKLDGKPEELQHFVHLRHLAEAALMLGGGYARAGKRAEARGALDEAKQAATTILSVPDVQESLRAEAKQFLAVVEKQLAALK